MSVSTKMSTEAAIARLAATIAKLIFLVFML